VPPRGCADILVPAWVCTFVVWGGGVDGGGGEGLGGQSGCTGGQGATSVGGFESVSSSAIAADALYVLVRYGW